MKIWTDEQCDAARSIAGKHSNDTGLGANGSFAMAVLCAEIAKHAYLFDSSPIKPCRVCGKTDKPPLGHSCGPTTYIEDRLIERIEALERRAPGVTFDPSASEAQTRGH